MGDTGDTYNAMREDKQAKRTANREQSAKILEQAGVKYTTRNFGVHLIVEGGAAGVIDFWPGTGRWQARSGKKGRGVGNLLSTISGSNTHS